MLWSALTVGLAGCGAVFPRYTAATRPPPPGLITGGRLSQPPMTVRVVRAAEAEAPPSKPSGEAWDGDGPPDLYVVLYRNDQELYRSPVATDATHPTFSDPGVAMYVSSSAAFRVELWDEDGPFDDLVGRQEFVGVPASALQGGQSLLRMEHGATVRLEASAPSPLLGLGVTYEVHGSHLRLLDVVADGPAGRAGLRLGDRITAVDGRAVSDLGEEGSRRALDRATARELDLEVERADGRRETMHVPVDAVYPAR
jgi:hypothetical protein